MTGILPKCFKCLSWCLALPLLSGPAWAREHQAPTAKVVVQSGQAGCHVELDADAKGATDAKGNLIILDVDPGDHYLHVRCPGKPEAAYFISPKANEETRILPAKDAPSALG